MKKEKKQIKRKNNGITLIALVITIIVLLILAGVTIATLTGENGILTRASEASIETRGASVEERKNLWKTEQQTDNYTNETTAKELNELLDDLVNEGLLTDAEKQTVLDSEDHSVQIGSRNIVFGNTLADDFKQGKIEAGDVIGYKATDGVSYTSYATKNGCSDQEFVSSSDVEWKVWGIDEETGGLMIVPSQPITSTAGEGLYIKGFPGYNNGVEELDNISEIYGHGKGAISARSLTEPDVTKILGFTEEDKKEAYSTYGTEIIATSGTWIDGTTITADNPKKGIDEYYEFSANDDNIPTKDNQKLYDLIFIEDTDEFYYLLATPFMMVNAFGDFNFYYYAVIWDGIDGFYMGDTENNVYDDFLGVRPVVILDKNCTASDLAE